MSIRVGTTPTGTVGGSAITVEGSTTPWVLSNLLNAIVRSETVMNERFSSPAGLIVIARPLCCAVEKLLPFTCVDPQQFWNTLPETRIRTPDLNSSRFLICQLEPS